MDQRHQAIEALYRDAIDLADGARRWFDGPGLAWRAGLPPAAQAAVATESLAITARLMAIMAWLLDPAHSGPDAAGRVLRPFILAPPPPLPAASPLDGTPGADIARGSRQLVARVLELAPGAAPPPSPPPPLPPVSSLWHA